MICVQVINSLFFCLGLEKMGRYVETNEPLERRIRDLYRFHHSSTWKGKKTFNNEHGRN